VANLLQMTPFYWAAPPAGVGTPAAAGELSPRATDPGKQPSPATAGDEETATMPTELTCPKCQSAMRNYERNGIQIDQCTGCRGVFLDRGELEHLLDAEAAYNQAAQPAVSQPIAPQPPIPRPPTSQPPAPQSPGYGWSRDDQRGRPAYGNEHRGNENRGKRRKGFLSELFDD
jgi:uncharacterized protein